MLVQGPFSPWLLDGVESMKTVRGHEHYRPGRAAEVPADLHRADTPSAAASAGTWEAAAGGFWSKPRRTPPHRAGSGGDAASETCNTSL